MSTSCQPEPTMTHTDGPATGALAREFPDWRIDALPGGLNAWSAYWQSDDGRERRVIVERSPADLLARLRNVAMVTS